MFLKEETFTPLSSILFGAMGTGPRVPPNTNTKPRPPKILTESDEEEAEFERKSKLFPVSDFSDVKFLTPAYWNGVRWADVGSTMNLGRKYHKKEFTIVSWNIWFGLRNREERMIRLGKAVRELDPDFVAFQEVTPPILQLITQQSWTKEYFISDPEGKLIENYGNVMFSKISFNECILKNLEGRMGRKAMLGTFLVQNAQPVTFGTFHLESYLEDTNFRAAQLEVFKNLTNHCPCVVLVGDTNFTSETESESLGSRFKDGWKELYQTTPEDEQRNPGLTFDTETNVMAKEEYAIQNIHEPKRQRLDRCFYTPETVELVSMRVLGDKPYEGKEYISDHYGIVIQFKLKG